MDLPRSNTGKSSGPEGPIQVGRAEKRSAIANGTPRPGYWIQSIDGRFPDSRVAARCLPSRSPSGHVGVALSAYSCGGSHGFGPDWVVRTVFPINPLEFIRRGTIDGRTMIRASESCQVRQRHETA